MLDQCLFDYTEEGYNALSNSHLYGIGVQKDERKSIFYHNLTLMRSDSNDVDYNEKNEDYYSTINEILFEKDYTEEEPYE